MPRRLKLTPNQRDIIVTLEEAGSESVGTVIATLRPSDRGAFDDAIAGLISLGLIRKERRTADEVETELVLTEAGFKALHT